MKVRIVSPLLCCLMIGASIAMARPGWTSPASPETPVIRYSHEQLSQLLAPIALYPDPLLSQILMAATYPIEVIEADRWLRDNPGLTGENLDIALLAMDWEPSVKSLCHVPDVLQLMSERIGQTTELGNAFLAQEQDVMTVVQELRSQAYAHGSLSTTPEQQVVVERETIIIEPRDPRVVYVPYYNPTVVYGSWRYPAFPPYYWVPAGLRAGRGISYWGGSSFAVVFGTWSLFDWNRHYIHIDAYQRPRYVRHDRWFSRPGRWYHVPKHRRGVAYHDRTLVRTFQRSSPPPQILKYDGGPFMRPSESGEYQLPFWRSRSEQQPSYERRPERKTIRIDRFQPRQRIDRPPPSRHSVSGDRRPRQQIESITPDRPRSSIIKRHIDDGRNVRHPGEHGRIGNKRVR